MTHRTTQEKERLTVFEIWNAERNGKTGELAQRGADLAEIRASEVKQARIEVFLAVEHVEHFHCFVNECVDRKDILPKEEHMGVCEQSGTSAITILSKLHTTKVKSSSGAISAQAIRDC